MPRHVVRLSPAAIAIVLKWNAEEAALRARVDGVRSVWAFKLLDIEFERKHAEFWNALASVTGLDLDDGCWSVDDSYLEGNGVCFLLRTDTPEEQEVPADLMGEGHETGRRVDLAAERHAGVCH